MASHLSSGRVNLAVLRESYRRELLEFLDKCAGSKALVWDDTLTGPFDLIADTYSLLKEHEVEKMYPLRPGHLPISNVQNIIFIVRPTLVNMEKIAQNVLKEEESGPFRKECHIYFVPRKSLMCERKLKELGVYGSFANVDEYCLDLVPFDSDLLSMEMETSFKDCVIDNDYTSLFYLAKALMTMQALYGIIPTIYGKGTCSRHLVDMMMRMRREMAGSEAQITPQIDSLLVIDRMVDPLTPLLSQLTYEGLIDEIFNISNTKVKLPPEKFISSNQAGGSDGSGPSSSSSSIRGSSKDEATEPKKLALNSSEELYAELRDKNFNAVGPTLKVKAKTIMAQFNERHSAKKVAELKQFVSKLPHMQAAKASLANHTSIAELIKEVTDSQEFMDSLRTQQEFINGIDTDKAHPYVEDCIARQEPLIKVLRLLCVQSICNNGLKPKLLDYYKREIIQTYGFEHMVTMNNLEKCELLRTQGPRTYPTIRKTLRLIVEDVNEQNPNDVSYVFSGYAPLSVRLAHFLHRPGWRSITEVLNLLPGPTIEEIQHIPVGLRKRRNSISSVHSGTGDQKVTLVVFIGGVTYAEVSALRFLSQLEDGPAEYIIATTKLINGETWIRSMMDTLEPKPPNPF